VVRLARRLKEPALATATVCGFLIGVLGAGPDPQRWLWFAVGSVALSALIPALGRRAWRLVERPARLERELVVKDRTIRELKRQLTKVDDERVAGVLEGRRQAVGEALAGQVEIPSLYAIMKRNSAVALVASCEGTGFAAPGARYFVVEEVSNTVKGVVEVDADLKRSGPNRLLALNLVEKWSPRFWEHLTDRVEFDTRPPPQVILKPYRMDAKTDGDDRLVEDGRA